MRKIIVPREAIERHEETPGRALLGYLKYLSRGGILTLKKRDKDQKEGNKYQATKSCCKHYWKWVYEQFRDKHILTASPMELLCFAHENLKKTEELGSSCHEEIKPVIEELFAYGELRSGHVLVEVGDSGGTILWSNGAKNLKKWKGWSLAEYFRLLDIRYCPYCNGETVGLVKRTDTNGGRKDSYSAIDHILPKEKYPLLALSLCNLVPACYKCNSQFKKNKDLFRIEEWSPDTPLLALHPYVHDFHKWFRFKYEPTSVENMFVREEDDSSPLLAELQNPLPVHNLKEHSDGHKNLFFKRVKEYLKVFDLQNSYRDLYAKEINEILMGEMICTQEFVAEMKDRYGLSKKDFDLVFRRTSLDPRDINRHRLAKLTIDLVKQFRQDVSRPQIISEWKKWWRQKKREVESRKADAVDAVD